jgi:hypothetical protein
MLNLTIVASTEVVGFLARAQCTVQLNNDRVTAQNAVLLGIDIRLEVAFHEGITTVDCQKLEAIST